MRKERSFVAAGAGANLDDRGAVIERIGGHEEGLELLFEARLLGFDAADFGPRFGGQLGVGNDNELARLRELVVEALEAPRAVDDRSEPLVVAPQRRESS